MDLQLAGLRALVTGGTKGIGHAIVEGLLAEGVSVAFCARTEADVVATVEKLSTDGVTVSGRALDVGDGDALKQWVADSAAELGGIDIVVSNVSALAIGEGEEFWQKSFDVDMMGTVRLVESAMPFLEQSQAAAIVTVSSVSGREIDFAAGAYGTFKAAIVHYTQGLAFQLRRQGDPGEHDLARQHLFPRRRLGEHRAEQPGALPGSPRAQPDRADGPAGRDRQGRRVPGQPGGKFRHWYEPGRRRRPNSWRAVLNCGATSVGRGSRQRGTWRCARWRSTRQGSR